MKRKIINIFLAILSVCGILTAILVINSKAQNDEFKQITPAVTEDFLTAGQNVEIKSEGVKGDAVIAGANVTVSGQVEGYLMAAGGTVDINAPIGNDLWVAGANINVNNSIADNAMVAGGTVVFEQTAKVGKDLRIACSSADIRGQITRNLKIAAANTQISSEIGGNVEAYTEKLVLNPGAVVRGNLIVHSPNEPVISPNAKVLGQVIYQKTEGREGSTASGFSRWFGNWILTFLWITVLGLVAVWFSPVWTNRVAEMLKAETAKSLLTGLVVMIVVPIVFIILLVSVIGLPLAFLLGAISFVAFLFSGVFISYLVGDLFLKQIKRWETSNVLKIVFGALMVTFVMALPWLGGLAKLAVMFFGVGAFLLERRDLLSKLREQGLA